jgi:hypothetical protein
MKAFVLNSNILSVAPSSISYEEMLKAINGNTGNSYITYAILKTLGLSTFLKKEEHVSNIWEDELPDPMYINDNYNVCFFTFQDQFKRIVPQYIKKIKLEKITKFLSKITIPVVSYSLGTNFTMTHSNTPKGGMFSNILVKKKNVIANDFKRLLQVLSEKSESIGIRGYITQEALSNIGINNTSVIGCPTYFENGENQIIIKQELSDDAAILGTGLFSSRNINPIYYIGQCEKVPLKICHGSHFTADDIYDVYQKALAYPGYADCFLTALENGRVKAFCNMDEWKDFIKIKKIILAVGTRVHGSIIAMNAGIPAVCTAGDSRAHEMCSYLGIPHMPGACGMDITISKFYDCFDPVTVALKYQDVLNEYNSWLLKNNLRNVTIVHE